MYIYTCVFIGASINDLADRLKDGGSFTDNVCNKDSPACLTPLRDKTSLVLWLVVLGTKGHHEGSGSTCVALERPPLVAGLCRIGC